jgi:hypothetical protein
MHGAQAKLQTRCITSAGMATAASDWRCCKLDVQQPLDGAVCFAKPHIAFCVCSLAGPIAMEMPLQDPSLTSFT